MKILIRFFLVCFLCACATGPKPEETASLPLPVATSEPPLPAMPRMVEMPALKSELGLTRDIRELGFAEKDYNGCRMSLPGDAQMCGQRFMSVVHFRLVCRDTVGTTSRVPSSLRPLRSKMQWRLNGKRGMLTTDKEGYGQVQMVSRSPSKEQRFMLIIGKKSLGVEAGEVTQIVVPGDWCKKWKS